MKCVPQELSVGAVDITRSSGRNSEKDNGWNCVHDMRLARG